VSDRPIMLQIDYEPEGQVENVGDMPGQHEPPAPSLWPTAGVRGGRFRGPQCGRRENAPRAHVWERL